jgi:hypothetical protein
LKIQKNVFLQNFENVENTEKTENPTEIVGYKTAQLGMALAIYRVVNKKSELVNHSGQKNGGFTHEKGM